MSADGFSVPPMGSTWVFTGDSITHGVFHTHGARSWVELVAERIRWELDRLDDLVINSGVSGRRVPDIAAGFDHLVGRFTPQVVSISLGTNDANAGADGVEEFRRALAGLASLVSDLGAVVVLHTPVLTLADAPVNRRTYLSTYAEQVRRVADEQDAVLVDHERYWRGHFGATAATPWLDDHSHPNAVGHRHMANTTLRALGLGELDERP